MISMRRAFAGVLATLFVLFSMGGVADASSRRTVPVIGASICETGHRGMPLYDRRCLTSGTFKTGANLWLSVPAGRKGHESPDSFDRRSVCKYAREFGGIRPAVRELFFDIAYDNYRNHPAVLTHAGNVARLDCLSMGYRV